jgi:DNA-binding GntR family transcriptional regulator
MHVVGFQVSFGDEDVGTAGRIARVLSDRIVLGELEPLAPLRQDHVAAEFKASHVPVREAFRQLEAQGLAVSQPRRGVRVAPLDPGSIMEISEMRAALETLALRHAVPKMTAQDARAVEAAVAADRATARDDLLALEGINRSFHDALLAPCSKPRLLAAIGQLHRASSRILIAMWKRLPDWQSQSAGEHEAIWKEAKAGRADAACGLLEAHILGGGRKLASILSGTAPSSGAGR